MLSLAAAMLAATACSASQVAVAVDPETVTVGDPFVYTVIIYADAGEIIPVPEKAELTDERLEIRDFTHEVHELPNNRTQLTLVYHIVCFEVGQVPVKATDITYKREDETEATHVIPPATVEVVSVLPADEEAQPRPLADPLTVAGGLSRFLWPLFALLALAVIAALIVRKRRKAAQIAGLPTERQPLEPDVTALNALAALKAQDLPAKGEMLEFFVQLDRIMRAWLQARFGIPAMERTYTGIMYRLRAMRAADDWRSDYLLLLRMCNAVKFAARLPDMGEAENALRLARTIIRESCPKTPAAIVREVDAK